MDIEFILKHVKSKQELRNCMQDLNPDVKTTYQECYNLCFDNLTYNPTFKLKIDSVADYLHDELNTGHWSEVPLTTRQAFTGVSFIKALVILKCPNTDPVCTLQEALKSIDMGLLLGAPFSDNHDLLTKSATVLSQDLSRLKPEQQPSQNKRKSTQTQHDSFIKLKGKEVPTLQCPSMEFFNKFHFLPQMPVKLQDCMTHWPATRKWPDVNYLLDVAGNRTVPIEIGSHYADENWTQKLMSLKEFIRDHYLGDSEAVGYLAQHNLFDQISELKGDICIPEYCALSRDYEDSGDPDINAWFGPKGTVSPLHFDPKDNLLAQVFGTKQILLYSPSDSERLYPHDDKLLFNTAQVDPFNPDLEKYPKCAEAQVYKCLLDAGEMLYIPLKWWHHVTALDKSFSVSFWWQ